MPPITSRHGRLELAGRLRAVVPRLHRALRQQTAELTATQASVLGSVARCGPIRLSDLADVERLSGAMISKVVANLEAADLIERLSDPDDGRVTLVRISAHGAEWLEAGRERRDRWLVERLATLDDAELAALTAAIPALERVVEDRS